MKTKIILFAVLTTVFACNSNTKNSEKKLIELNKAHVENNKLGIITNVKIFLVAEFLDGTKVKVKDLTEPIKPLPLYGKTLLAKLPDSTEVFLDNVMLKSMARVSIDIDNNLVADTTIVYPYIGQKAFQQIKLYCGNTLTMKN